MCFRHDVCNNDYFLKTFVTVPGGGGGYTGYKNVKGLFLKKDVSPHKPDN